MASLYQAEQEARGIVNRWSAAAASIGWLPGSSVLLGGADYKMISGVAKAFGVTNYDPEMVAGTMAATVAGYGTKVALFEAMNFVPVVGQVVKSGLAAAVTKAVGEAVIDHFKARSPYR